ncbi:MULTISPECIES: IS3 family transposase [Bacillus cereus group]
MLFRYFVQNYNYNRSQWTLKKMASVQYQNHLLST